MLVGAIDLLEHAEKMIGGDGIEDVTDMVIGGDLVDVEEALCVAASTLAVHGPLEGQEGGALHEEDGKGAQANVGHGESGVGPLATIGQSRGAIAQPLNLIAEPECAHERVEAASAPREPTDKPLM